MRDQLTRVYVQAKLSVREQRYFEAAVLEGCRYTAVADRYDTTPLNVRVAVCRARRKIRTVADRPTWLRLRTP